MMRLVVAPLEAIIGILAIRHLFTISEESLHQQVTISGKSLLNVLSQKLLPYQEL
jgi:hypothetical protein